MGFVLLVAAKTSAQRAFWCSAYSHFHQSIFGRWRSNFNDITVG